MKGELTRVNNDMHDPEMWVDLYGDFLYRFAFSRVKDSMAAEDLVQETYLAALVAYKNFKGHSTLRTWLIAILKNKSVDHIRKKVREKTSDEIESLANGVGHNIKGQGEWPFQFCNWSNSPRNLFAKKEFMDTLHKCLTKLPGRLAEIFFMKEIDGLSTEQICEALNITRTNCWVMLHRARRRLRACTEIYLFDSQNRDTYGIRDKGRGHAVSIENMTQRKGVKNGFKSSCAF
jgi:RNA polymerase sigma-70 factor (ECF subfamily)